MPKNTRSESTSDSAVGVSGIDLEAMVQTACEKAVQVLKQEFVKMFSEFSDRLGSVEKRLVAIEQTSADHTAAMNDFSNRLMEVQCAMDGVVADGGEGSRVQEVKKELEGVRAEARAAICAANDVEQYGRRNNIQIRGLAIDEVTDCRASVVTFLNNKLNMNIIADDIETAHILPTRPANTEPTQPSAENTPRQRGRPPVVIVRFSKRELRDNILQKRRQLKNTRFAIVEDLTALNSKTLNRVRNDPDVAAAWTWNGKITVLTNSGNKQIVKPFQSLH